MAEDSEKRFHQIMDKLFHAPSSTPARSFGAQSLRDKKRLNPSSALAPVDPTMRLDIINGSQHSSALMQSSQAPLCRPWVRGDLMRRLATFKSMTWFAKPKVVSAVNCARRGWVNVDMDIIACEACGARLLFSTPSSWTRQQVEKAASVFSLKLDNGHKLLCPWIDNACDETLAEFPPTTAPDLVDKFKERSSALLQLLALPEISSSAIEYMRSPELEEFLIQSSILEYGNSSADLSESESLGNENEAKSAKLYYQAEKLISLCGWEPRSLPYVVDCKKKSYESVKDADILNSSQEVANGQNLSINAHSDYTNKILEEANENSGVHYEVQSDPKSIVLDCRLCGATVGLWVFSTVPRPLELFRIVGYTEVNGENKSGAHDSGNENHGNNRDGLGDTVSRGKEKLPSFNLTIAGGPPPTKQNFKATISLPVIGRNLRARFSYDSEFRDRTYNKQDDTHSELKNKKLSQGEKHSGGYNISRQVAQLDGIGQLGSKKDDQRHLIFMTNHQSPCLEQGIAEKGDTFRKDNNNYTSLGGTNVSGEGSSESGRRDSNMENSTEITQDDNPPENLENVGFICSTMEDLGNSQVGDVSGTSQDANVTIRNGDAGQSDLLELITFDDCSRQETLKIDMVCSKEISLASHQQCLCECDTSCFHSRENKTCSDGKESVGAQSNSQEGIIERMQTPGNNKVKGSTAGKDLKQLPLDKAMKFDPIRQHRHFCPWIASTGSRAPGWRQTLSALQHLKEFSHLSPTDSPSSTSLIKVDDPITSVRKLFMSPSAKRMKLTPGSS